MARISAYPFDNNVTDNDAWIGTDAANRSTKQFTAEAVAKYSELKPDLVTMDVIMPDMSGVDAVKEIKKVDSSAKIVVVSAMGQQPVVAELLKEGALDYIVKPFQPARVLESIDKLIDK